MRKILFYLTAFISLNAFAQKKKFIPASIDTDSVLLSKVKYRLVGPFRGGRSGAVAGSYKNKNTFYFGATGAEFGKQPMEVVTGKILQINILVELLVPLLWLRVMKTSFMSEKVKIPCVVM